MKASAPGNYDQFGSEVAISESGDTIAVSAFGESTVGYYSGAVYVFQKSDMAWEQQAFLKAPYPTELGSFGGSLSDDRQTLAIGAYGDSSAAIGVNGDQYDANSESSGAVHLYRLKNGEWQQQAYLKTSNTTPITDDELGPGHLGLSLELSGNGEVLAAAAEDGNSSATGINGDQESKDAIASGAVYLY